MSVTCIGMDQKGKVDVVWFFHGQEAITGLRAFRAIICQKHNCIFKCVTAQVHLQMGNVMGA